jgi:hypothetical protein
MSKRIALAFVAVAIISAGLLFLRLPQARAGSFNAPVLLVHGFNVGSAVNCDTGSMWGTIETYFRNQGYTNVRSVGFYRGDSNCGDNLGQESSHCTGWYDSGSNDGTVNEDIRHTTCLLAWYIWDHYTQYGTTVAVMGHSMGGILIRQAMNDTPYVGLFPPYVKISDVATVGAPHQGLKSGSAWVWSTFQGCPGNCVEVSQMERANALMSNMNSTSFRGGFARNPQGSGGTDWTTMSSNNDELLSNGCTSSSERKGAPSIVSTTAACGLMPGATHFVVYPGSFPNYCHGCYLTDSDTTWNATEAYSDTNGSVWYSGSSDEHSIFTLYYAILYSSW